MGVNEQVRAIDEPCANKSDYYQYENYRNHFYTLLQLNKEQMEAAAVGFQLIKQKGKKNNTLSS